MPRRAAAANASPNGKLNVAVIGVAGRGGANLGGVSSQNIVALCDVDANNLARAAKRFPGAATFADFRRMLDKLERQIDAVVVSTPDHTHAVAAAMAMRMGKHCYCEKPLTHSVHECRTLIELAGKNKLVTQMGTQIHAGGNYRRVVEIVQAGLLGVVREVHVWHTVSYGGGDRPKDTPPVPEHLSWDLWLGPAPQRPYHPCYLPGRWRGWSDFGTGGLGDFGCHYMDLPFWALKLRHPTTVEADGPPVHPESTPRWLEVRYEFPARGDLPPVKMNWYDGGRRPAMLDDVLQPLGGDAANKWRCGILFVGAKGMVLANYGSRLLLPTGKFADVEPPKETIPASIGHHREWIEACKAAGPTTCNFDYSGTLAEAVLLGTVAYRAGEKLTWNARDLKATNCPKADRYIRRDYRKGWTL
ncbi:MAG: Gfo/Idh/MocA family oxidoreductase, partial [Phycisphaerae bacterium]